MQQQKCCQRSMEPIFEAYICSLRRQLDCVAGDRAGLESELCSLQDTLEGYKKKCVCFYFNLGLGFHIYKMF